ncbi:MAG TPA: OmpA family protein, partial [Variovorax sp.]|nr:OmpA family protein [Variovorax sp.]
MKQLDFFAAAALVCVAASAAAPPEKDHPLVGRYEGAVLDGTKVTAYDEVGLIKEPFQNWGGGKPELLKLEGKVSLYHYKLPGERSLLEVQRNYEASLKAKGFEVLFTCGTANGSCYRPRPDSANTTTPYDFALALDDPEWPRLGSRGDYVRNYFSVSGRYLLAKKTGPAGTVYASIALAEHNAEVGNHAFVRVVESKSMESDKIVFVDASAMQKSLAETGRINLYGILFDLDKDQIRPESQPTLDEIAKLMRGNPPLKLSVVGHTDAQGDAAHNDDLSKRRAVAVIGALVKAGVDPRR